MSELDWLAAYRRLTELERAAKGGMGDWSQKRQEVKELRKRYDADERSEDLFRKIFAIATE